MKPAEVPLLQFQRLCECEPCSLGSFTSNSQWNDPCEMPEEQLLPELHVLSGAESCKRYKSGCYANTMLTCCESDVGMSCRDVRSRCTLEMNLAKDLKSS